MGYYDYKRRLGARVEHVEAITAVSASLGGRIRWRLAQAASWWRSVWYYRIWYWRLMPRLRRLFKRHPRLLRRSLSQQFLRTRFLVGAGGAQRRQLRRRYEWAPQTLCFAGRAGTS
jgi:hypothetical protein